MREPSQAIRTDMLPNIPLTTNFAKAAGVSAEELADVAVRRILSSEHNVPGGHEPGSRSYCPECFPDAARAASVRSINKAQRRNLVRSNKPTGSSPS